MAGATLIRPATAADAEALAALHARSISPAWSATEIAWMLDPPGLGLVAERAQAMAGFVLARAVAGEGEILTLAVRPDERRQGVATALLSGLLGELRRGKVADLFLEVADDNAAALGLYTRLGFREKARRRGYYTRAPAAPADAIVMWRLTAIDGD